MGVGIVNDEQQLEACALMGNASGLFGAKPEAEVEVRVVVEFAS
jgi:hypothetical protein